MQYIYTLPIYFFLLSLIIFIPLRYIVLKRNDRKIILYNESICILWIIYMESLLYLTTFPSGDVNRSDWVSVNLIPFNTIKDYLFLLFHGNVSVAFINLIGNIIVFIPIGILLVLWNGKITFKKMVMIGFIVSLVIELTQLILSHLNILARSFDVDDLLLNTSGVIIGFAVMKLGANYLFKK